jgi:hypothetical protein
MAPLPIGMFQILVLENGCIRGSRVAAAAEQLAVVPPSLPSQLHDHGPVPPTDEAAPMLQRSVVGAVLRVRPLDDPHAPLTREANKGAEQRAVEPNLLPVQLQYQGPVPVTDEAIPTLHRLVVGAVTAAAPLAAPQEPSTIFAAKATLEGRASAQSKMKQKFFIINRLLMQRKHPTKDFGWLC